MNGKFNHNANNIFAFICFMLKNRVFTIDKAILHLEKSEINIEKETILKYIRTLQKVGFNFEKTNNKTYLLKDIPLKINCDNNDEQAALLISEAINNPTSDDVISVLKKIMDVIPIDKKEYLQKKIAETTNAKKKNSHIRYERFCAEGQRLKINIKNSAEQIIFEPDEIINEKGIFYLKGIDVKQRRTSLIKTEAIRYAEQMPVKNKFHPVKQEAVINFSSQISKIYVLKESEVVLKKTPLSLVVKTTYEDEERFYKRILKYMGTCTILSPEFLVKRFAKYAKELYQMYDCPK